MIPKETINSQNGKTGQSPSLGRSYASRILALLPKSAPSTIYNTALKIPVARDILGVVVRSMIPEKIQAHGCTLFLDKEDIAVSGALALSGFESFETSVFEQALRPGATVVDIGAHIGYYALLSAARVGPGGRVIAFEPEPRNFGLLQKNIVANRCANVTAVNIAAADSAGTRDFFIEKYNKGHHSFGKGRGTAGAITVKTATADSILAAQGVTKVDIIKIDIEGAEPIAFRGLAHAIAKNPDIIIFTEFYPQSIKRLGGSPAEFLRSFASAGFKIWHIDEEARILTLIPDTEAFAAGFPKGEHFANLLISRK